MEMAFSSENLVTTNQTTWCHYTTEYNLNHHLGGLKSP